MGKVDVNRQFGLLVAFTLLAWLGLYLHNDVDLPTLTILSPENSLPALVSGVLVCAWRVTPWKRAVATILLAWSILHLVGGGILSVLPLPIWPYEPAQTMTHYAMHLLYGAAQLPLIWLLADMVRARVPTLETDRLALRPIAADDAYVLHRISNEPGVRRYLWDDEPVEKATIRDLISQSIQMYLEEGIGLFGVRRRGSESFIGFCGFVRLEGMQEPELAYELTQEAWGEGIATEAVLACMCHGFVAAGLQRTIAGADTPNVASARVIEKLGMRFVGSVNPKAPEEPYYAVYREEFLIGSGREE